MLNIVKQSDTFLKFNLIDVAMFKTTCFYKIVFYLSFFLALAKPNLYGQCNAQDPISFVSATRGTLTTSSSSTGVCIPLLGCSISNVSVLIDVDLTNFITVSTPLGLGVTHNLRVTDGNSAYSADTFVESQLLNNYADGITYTK